MGMVCGRMTEACWVSNSQSIKTFHMKLESTSDKNFASEVPRIRLDSILLKCLDRNKTPFGEVLP